ncbi:hypothetical protein AVEN_51593-1 [Araneus ventricosus]|uniref:Uncharacterized protein n=1 Tax=Araneus ventricosus TaxID=182803 RepID=A0A4Y2N724_ARAVE|nr:hypothetical protein AVEN_51593-1 [Araneus ventricosus]
MQQNLKRVCNWGNSQRRRRTLYDTVVEILLAHGFSAWCLNPTSKLRGNFLRFKGNSYFIYRKHIDQPNGSVTDDVRHPTPTLAITVRIQIYISLSPKNISSP